MNYEETIGTGVGIPEMMAMWLMEMDEALHALQNLGTDALVGEQKSEILDMSFEEMDLMMELLNEMI